MPYPMKWTELDALYSPGTVDTAVLEALNACENKDTDFTRSNCCPLVLVFASSTFAGGRVTDAVVWLAVVHLPSGDEWELDGSGLPFFNGPNQPGILLWGIPDAQWCPNPGTAPTPLRGSGLRLAGRQRGRYELQPGDEWFTIEDFQTGKYPADRRHDVRELTILDGRGGGVPPTPSPIDETRRAFSDALRRVWDGDASALAMLTEVLQSIPEDQTELLRDCIARLYSRGFPLPKDNQEVLAQARLWIAARIAVCYRCHLRDLWEPGYIEPIADLLEKGGIQLLKGLLDLLGFPEEQGRQISGVVVDAAAQRGLWTLLGSIGDGTGSVVRQTVTDHVLEVVGRGRGDEHWDKDVVGWLVMQGAEGRPESSLWKLLGEVARTPDHPWETMSVEQRLATILETTGRGRFLPSLVEWAVQVKAEGKSWWAVQVAGLFPSRNEAWRALELLTDEQDPEVRITVAEVCSKTVSAPGPAVQLLSRLGHDHCASVRAATARAYAAYVGRRGVWAALECFASDAEPEVRVALIRTCEKAIETRKEAAKPAPKRALSLLCRLAGDSCAEVRRKLVQAARLFLTRDDAWAVLEEFADDRELGLRAQVAQACGAARAKPKRAAGLLVGLASDPEKHVRVSVANACGTLPLTQALWPALLALVSAGTAEMPGACLTAIGTTAALLGGRKATKVLERLADDTDPLVLKTVALAAGYVGGAGAVGVLGKVLNSGLSGRDEPAPLEEGGRLEVRSRLEELRKRACGRGYVVRMTFHGSRQITCAEWLPGDVRSQAFESLGALWDVSEARDLLCRLVASADAGLRLGAVRILGKYGAGDGTAESILSGLAEDGDEAVRRVARETLASL